MKNFWKNIFMALIMVVTIFNFYGCKKDSKYETKDLDGDGKISVWEMPFEKLKSSNRAFSNNDIVEISNLSQLKSINDKSTDESKNNLVKCYKLTSDIDCEGQEISLNLRNSFFYGNNKIISNYKLADINVNSENHFVKGFMYNGAGVYDLRLFMGKQDYNLNNSGSTIIGSFVNVPVIENVDVKGFINATKSKPNVLGANIIDISLLSVDNQNAKDLIGDLKQDSFNKLIKDVEVFGKINLFEENDCRSESSVGGVSASVHKDCILMNTNAFVDINTKSSKLLNAGILAGKNNGFISTCKTSGNINADHIACNEINIGGVCGNNYGFAEIKNATTNANISFQYKETLNNDKYVLAMGGIVGKCTDSVLNYCISDAVLSVENANLLEIGGICGLNHDSVFDKVISRGNIVIKNTEDIYASNMIGKSKNGFISSAIISTNVNILNLEKYGKIKLGSVTIFEDFEKMSVVHPQTYNAEYSPNFKGILLTGQNNIEVKSIAGSNILTNLGVLNYFTYEDKTKVQGQDEEGNVIYELMDLSPQIFRDVVVLQNTDTENKYKKYNISIKTGKEIHDVEWKNGFCSRLSMDSEQFIKNCYTKFGFRYGVSNADIDLSSDKIENIKFILDDSMKNTKYFEKKYFNGKYVPYDNNFSDIVNLNMNDEFSSFIFATLRNNVAVNKPLVFGKEFLTNLYHLEINRDDSYDPEKNLDALTNVEIYHYFKMYMQNALKLIALNNEDVLEILEYGMYEKPDSDKIKYMILKMKWKNNIHTFKFDVRPILDEDETRIADYYTFCFTYSNDIEN